MADAERTAAVIVSWEGGEATRRCVASLRAQTHPPARIVVVDNASGARERAELVAALGAAPGVDLLLLDDNRQFAGGLNAGARAALAAGATRVLLLNNDTVLAPGALAALEAALDADPGAGLAGPRVCDLGRGERVLSLGERHVVAGLCLPRSLLRYRRPRRGPYRVRGIMGCGILATRRCFEAVGGFDEEIQVYYEDVDFCLAARARGFAALIAPDAVLYHDGLRGFAAGLTPWAARLKARNPWLVLRRHGSPVAWLLFLPTYAAMLAASAALYALRGRGDVVRALGAGAVAGVRAGLGAAVAPAGAPRGPQ